MKTIRRLAKAMGFCSILAACCCSVQADVYQPKDARRIAPVRSAEEVISDLPAIAKIPKSFIIGDGFKLKLTEKYLRIDHMATNSRAPVSRRECMLGLHIASPVAFFGSTMEIPLLNARTMTSRWTASSLGDYVLQFSKDAPVEDPTFMLRLSARF